MKLVIRDGATLRAMRKPLVALGLLLVACGQPATPPAKPGAPAYTAPTLRLPAIAKPRRYDLSLTIDPGGTEYRGDVASDLDVLAPTDILWLNATGLTIDRAQLVRPGAAPLVARVVPGNDDFVGFAFPAPIAAGPARLEVSFGGKLDGERALGIYRQAEPDGQSYAYTFFEPLDARRAFPCFDEPGYKVPWAITLHVKQEHVARANAKVLSETPEANGMKAVRFEESRPIPSYLVAFVVGPFDVVEAADAGKHGTPLRFLVPKGRGAETRYAASITPRVVGALEDWFGMPYPYGKLDVAVPPRFWGTMEHPGIVAMGQPLTLMKEETLERKKSYTNTASHELAHYWFGDYVTMQWWDDTWLNESLAQWMDMKITAAAEPTWHFERERLQRAQSAMAADELPSAKRIRQPIVTKDDIANAFDGELTYNKGASVMAMLEGWLGPARVQRAIRAYLQAHAWGNATADDLLTTFDAELGPQASTMMRSFIDQPGLPLVRAEIDCAAKAITVTQKRFVPQGVSLPDETWKVPVCVRHGGASGPATRACVLMDAASAKIPLEGGACPTWVVANDEATGYYRADYTRPQIDRLVATKGALRPTELASITSDASALVRAGRLQMDDAMPLLSPAFASSDRLVFGAAADIHALAHRMLGKDERLASFVRRALTTRARTLGWSPKAGESIEDEEMRPLVLRLWASGGHDAQVEREARGLAEKWLADRKAMAIEIASAALFAGARGNDPAFFDAVLAEARRTTDRREKGLLFAVLGRFTAPALVARAQAIVAGREDDLHDAIAILYVQLGDIELEAQAARFLDASWDAITSRQREDENQWLFSALGMGCDEARATEVKRMFGPRTAKIPGAPRTLDRALEEIHVCATLAKTSRPRAAAFLEGAKK